MSTTDTSPAAILFDKNLSAISTFNDGTYNRLCVDTRPTAGVQPQQPAFGVGSVANTVQTPLVNGSATGLNVNGSTNPQVFSFAAQSKLVTIYGVRLAFTFAAISPNGTSFGNTTLAKGITIGANINGSSVSPLVTVKTNEDIFTLNGGGNFISPGSGYMVFGLALFNQPLAANTSDAITVTIQDNLSGANILYGRATAYGVRSS